MLPGAAATQLGIFIGYDRAGWRGGVLAGLCFMLPAFLIMLGLTLLYTTYGTLPSARHAFYGLGPVVLGIFIVAVCRLGKSAFQAPGQAVIGAAARSLGKRLSAPERERDAERRRAGGPLRGVLPGRIARDDSR